MEKHQERVIAEKNELFRKLTALREFSTSASFQLLRKGEQLRMLRQERIMNDYLNVLTEREDAFL